MAEAAHKKIKLRKNFNPVMLRKDKLLSVRKMFVE